MTHTEWLKAREAWQAERDRVAGACPEPPAKRWLYGDQCTLSYSVDLCGLVIYDGRHTATLSPEQARDLGAFIAEHFHAPDALDKPKEA